MKRFAFFLVPLLLMVGAVFSGWQPDAAFQAKATSYHSPTNARQDLTPAVNGQLLGFALTPVTTPVTGIVLETYFYEGQVVQQGQLLAKLWVRSTNDRAYVTAPQSGVITHAHVLIREVWPAAKPLLSLANPTRLHVRLTPSASVPPVRLHDRLFLQLASGSTVAVPGQVMQLDVPGMTHRALTVQLTRPLCGAVPGSALIIRRATALAPQIVTTLASK
jgi:hypothetical protein